MRRAAKRDANEPEIVAALRAAGYWVAQISHKGFPDLVVGRKGRSFVCLMEVKDGNGDLTDDQLQFFQMTEGSARFVVRSPESALRIASTWIGGNTDGGSDD